MDFLVWIIILLVINGVASGKKKNKQQPPAAPPNVNEQQSSASQTGSESLGGFVREFVQDIQDVMFDGDGSQRKQPQRRHESSQRQRSGRRQQRELTPIEQECEYCAGTNILDEPFSREQAAALTATQPIIPLEAAGSGFVDMQALQKNLKLSDAQNAVLWQEILDKPLALRKRK